MLCWCPTTGYALGHVIGDGEALARFLPDYLVRTGEPIGYPYDITHLRWNVHGDNGSPDEKVADVVRDWNARYAWPRLIITTTAAAFREFERRYGDKLPEFSGDYTPYWEDGAASSARETALNRASAERLVQAETLWAIRNPGPFPAAAFQEAWRNVLLYSEHTWGAHNSISQPDLPFVLDQWKVKQAFALDADKQSQAVAGARRSAPVPGAATRAPGSRTCCARDGRTPAKPGRLQHLLLAAHRPGDALRRAVRRRRPRRGRQGQARAVAAPVERRAGLPGAQGAALFGQAVPG